MPRERLKPEVCLRLGIFQHTKHEMTRLTRQEFPLSLFHLTASQVEVIDGVVMRDELPLLDSFHPPSQKTKERGRRRIAAEAV